MIGPCRTDAGPSERIEERGERKVEQTALDISARSSRESNAPAVLALAGSGGMTLLFAEATLPVYTSARLRKQQTQRRLVWLNGLLDDPAQFEAVVTSGRYLKLCAMLEWASDSDMIAGARLNGVVASAAAAIRSGAE
jgi:hypothetical protein